MLTPQTWISGEESEAKKIIANLKKQASSEAEKLEQEERDTLEIGNHDVNHEDAPASQEGGNESDVTQNSSESSESMQLVERKRGKVAENPRRRSTRSKASAKKAS